jgi:hypothetical protein
MCARMQKCLSSIVPTHNSTGISVILTPPIVCYCAIHTKKQNVRKSKAAYIPCTTSGIIDDMSDPFPFTSSGSQWQGITDRVMGGISNGSLSRETIGGKLANVLRGNVSLANNGGFIQMATDLSLEPSVNLFVDASAYDGVELEVYCEGSESIEKFNVQ